MKGNDTRTVRILIAREEMNTQRRRRKNRQRERERERERQANGWTLELRYQAKTACDLLRNPDDKFKYCLNVIDNEQLYYNDCLWDYCTAAIKQNESISTALCGAFDAMSRECSDNFVNVMWRNKNRCRKY